MPNAYTFPHDYLGEGFDVVFERLASASIDTATVAMAYHTSRDVFPHNPEGVIRYLEGGVTYFRPRSELYPPDGPCPVEAGLTVGTEFVKELIAAADRSEFGLAAWVVLLHNTRLAMAHPECAVQTALGDPLLNSLCPANPKVADYVLGLVRDVAERGFGEIKLESHSYMGFEHGYHHERSLVAFSPLVRFLLGICFCRHCVAAGEKDGVDAMAVRAEVASLIAAELKSSPGDDRNEVDREAVSLIADGNFGGLVQSRMRIVKELLASIVATVRGVSPSIGVRAIDPSGAILGYATGYPTFDDNATTIAWRDGLDLAGISELCDIAVTGYFAEPERLRRELEAYTGVLGEECVSDLELVLRPTHPDTSSAAELVAKVDVAHVAGVRELGFYHYGLMRLESLDWITHALKGK